MKKTIISAVALILTVLMVVGCNMIVYDAEKDKQTVIATVNGVDVVKGSIMDEIDTTLQYAGITDTEDMTEEEQDSYDEIVDAAINELIEYELCRQHAEELGIQEVSEEQLANIDSTIQSGIDSYADYFQSLYAEEENVDELVEEAIENYRSMYGIDNGSYRAQLVRNAYLNNAKDTLIGDYEPTTADLEEWQTVNGEQQKETFEANPSSLESYYGQPSHLYMPDGVRYVKSILIGLDQEDMDEITALRGEGDEEGANALRKEKLKAIKERADEMLALATAEDADFDALIMEYSDDEGLKVEPEATEGYFVYEGKTSFDQDYVNAAMALKKVGDMTGLVESDFGYFIIKYIGDADAGLLPLEGERLEYVTTATIETERSDLYDATMEEWKAESEIEIFKDKI